MLETWRSLMSPLAIEVTSRQAASAPGAPVLSGVVEKLGDEAHPELLLRLDRPAPGPAHLFVMPMGGQVLVSIRSYH